MGDLGNPSSGYILTEQQIEDLSQNLTRWRITSASATTTLTGVDSYGVTLSYDAGLEKVYRNGVLLMPGADYTRTSSSTITLATTLVAGDSVEVISFVRVGDQTYYSQAQTDALITKDNLLINPEFNINQRAFAGGALSSGVYGYDRWKGGSPCTVSVSAGVITLTGQLWQAIESPGLAGAIVTISVETPSAALRVYVGSHPANLVFGSIPAGTGRQSVTVTVPVTATGTVDVLIDTLAGSGVTFSKPKVERGSVATPFVSRPTALEDMLCRRYYETGKRLWSTEFTSGTTYYDTSYFRVPKRANPTMTTTWTGSGAWTSVTADNIDTLGFRGRAIAPSSSWLNWAIDWTASAEL